MANSRTFTRELTFSDIYYCVTVLTLLRFQSIQNQYYIFSEVSGQMVLIVNWTCARSFSTVIDIFWENILIVKFCWPNMRISILFCIVF